MLLPSKDHISKISLVVDDGGFTTTRLYGQGEKVKYEAYERILEVAQATDSIIPIAVTAAYIDVNNIANQGMCNPEAERIIQLLKDNSQFLPVWNHGLTHSVAGRPTEFMLCNEHISEETQLQHLTTSAEIFRTVGLDCSDVLVPPGHYWQPGVTDRIARQLGFEYLAVKEYEKTPLLKWRLGLGDAYSQLWPESEYLNTLWRTGLGIPSFKTSLNSLDCIKAMQFARPQNRFLHYLVHRRRQEIKTPHHFFCHVQNFNGHGSVAHWIRIIHYLQNEALSRQKVG